MNYTTLSPEEAASDDAPRFPFAFLANDNTLIGADSLTGLCESMISGYSELEGLDERLGDPWLEARAAALTSLADTTQAVLLDQALSQHPDPRPVLSEEELTALLHPKGEEVLEFAEWPHDDIPLLLMATSYAPYSEIPAPSGDGIIWLNPHDERRFVDSIARLGLGTLYIDEAQLEEAGDLDEF